MFCWVFTIHQNIINMAKYPESTLFICCWKISGTLEFTNGSLLKQNLSKGVMKVVNNLDSSANRICQNPLLASSLLKKFAPDNCASVVSNLGMGCTSLNTFSFSGLRSTQIRTAPESLATTIIAAHQGVGCLTGEITPRLYIRCNSHLTFGRSGRGYFVESLKQMTSCLV